VGQHLPGQSRQCTGGVFFSSGLNWSQQRSFMAYALKDVGARRDHLSLAMEKEADEFCAWLESFDRCVVDTDGIKDRLGVATFNSLWTLISGQPFDPQDEDFQKLFHLYSR